MDIREYARAFDAVEQDFEQSVEAFGVPFETRETEPRRMRQECAAACGCRCENGDASLWSSWISPACLACRTGERTATFFIDLKCMRHCYFCFNPNQDHYEYFLTHKRDIAAELEDAHRKGVRFDCLAITGGEPLLHKDEVVAFLRTARTLYPQAHVRLYTCGDLLDPATLEELRAEGLDEIRVSVKPVEEDPHSEQTYEAIGRAVAALPAVVIEVPVIPGSLEEMKELLVRADELGVAGVNLLEMCFPLHNAEAFRSRGFKLRKHPYAYLYDYWYGGGVPVAGSEAEALELMKFAQAQGLRIGIHYCSSDNKNTGQLYQQNKMFDRVGELKSAYPWISWDSKDYLLKCAKAFGGDATAVRAWAQANGVPCGFDPDVPAVAFPLRALDEARRAFPSMHAGVSINVVERREDAWVLREIALDQVADGRA